MSKFAACGAACALLIGAVYLSGCNTAPSKSDDEGSAAYRLTGVIVKDPNLDRSWIETLVYRNDSLINTAFVTLGSTALAYGSSAYQLVMSRAENLTSGTKQVAVRDSSRFADTISVVVPGVPSIDNIIPANRINNGGDQVSIEWTGAAETAGYVIAAVPRDSAYRGVGYTAWVTSLATSGTIPPDAFRWSDGENPDTGWYNIYVYAYTGAPDSLTATSRFIGSRALPTGLPTQLAANLAEKNLEGHFGVVTVSPRDSVHVTVLAGAAAGQGLRHRD